MTVAALLPHVFDLLALLAAPPLLLGVVNKTKAAFAGRRGPPLVQPYRDLRRLAGKGSVFSRTTTWVFRAAPIVALVATVLAGLLVPLGPGTTLLGFQGDLVLFAYLLALGRFFMTSAALDTGSPFEAMGAAREITYACLAEPALFFVLLCLVQLSGSLSMGPMLSAPHDGHVPSMVLCVVGLLVVMLLETSRVPFDDPNTHLELTMIHEVMVLDHSGRLLGAILYGAAMKLFVLGSVVVRVALPADVGPWTGRLLLCFGLLVLSVGIGVVESVMGRVRLQKIPSVIAAATVLTGFAFLLMVR